MISLPSRSSITADGVYSCPPEKPGSSVIVEIADNFGGGTVTLGYESPDNQFLSYKVSIAGDDVTTTVPESYEVTVPSSGRIAVTVAGSTNPSIKIFITEKV